MCISYTSRYYQKEKEDGNSVLETVYQLLVDNPDLLPGAAREPVKESLCRPAQVKFEVYHVFLLVFPNLTLIITNVGPTGDYGIHCASRFM